MEKDDDSEVKYLAKGQLEGLSDGIFAFAMTHLVIGLNIPVKSEIVQSTDFVVHTLVSLRPDSLHYMFSRF